MQFPYLIYSEDRLVNEYKKLQQLDTSALLVTDKNKINYKNNYEYDYPILFVVSYLTCKYGIISNNFFQNERMKTKFGYHKSPIDIWNSVDDRKRILDIVKRKYKKNTFTNSEIINGAYQYFHISSQFKIYLSKFIFDFFKPKTILDFSCGWGDRLVGFYSSEYTKKYIGIDCNKKLKIPYKNLEKFLKKNTDIKKKTKFIFKCSEDTDIGENIDMIFTSPPFFNLEVYSKLQNQSNIKYNKISIWLEKFLFRSLDNHIKHLNKNGTIILNISDYRLGTRDFIIIKPLIEFMSKIKNIKFLGMIPFETKSRLKLQKSYEPMFIWIKYVF